MFLAVRLFAVAVGALVISACSLRAPPLHSVIDGAPPALDATPFFAQTALQCGPAVLAIVLTDAGVTSATPAALEPRLFLPERGGSLQAELLAQTRAHDRLPVQLDGRMQAIADALAAGYPVAVLQNLNSPAAPQWHYAVVIGLDPANDRVMLRSGTTRRLEMPASRFMRSWSLAGRWAFVVAAPDAVPAFVTQRQWLEAAAPAESSGKPALATIAYAAALRRWPTSPMLWTALGNARHAAGEPGRAVRAWQKALSLDPDFAVARANLEAVSAPETQAIP